MKKTIYLARHAKSSWNLGFTKDFDRPLNKRGEQNAVTMAQALKARAWLPELILASPAMRAKQTCEAYCAGLGVPLQTVEWDASIYEAYTITLIQLLMRLPDTTQSVMLIGHNPSLDSVMEQLLESHSVRSAQQADGKLLTTGNVAKLVFTGNWQDLLAADISLDELLRPKTLSH